MFKVGATRQSVDSGWRRAETILTPKEVYEQDQSQLSVNSILRY